ncbi:hypothetical protein O3G_MSEX012186 [Manduca sexta]|nr:hypothetical protein O3G_MSEX012186 [Manduca sexta]
MWWAIWCVMVVVSSAASAAPAPDSAPMDLVQIDSAGPDDESLGYAVSSLEGRYGAEAPWLYLLAEMPRDSQVASSGMPPRSRRSFSVNPAVDILQHRYMEKVAQNNRNFLNRVGKRDQWRSFYEN